MTEQKVAKSISSDGSGATVSIGGSLSIEDAVELHRALSEALAEAPMVILDARHLEELDLTILQTLCSACKSAAASGRALRFEGDPPACMKSLNNGLGAHMGSPCRKNNDQPCIFFGGAR